MRINKRNIKKTYTKPLLKSVFIDVKLNDDPEFPSDPTPPIEPPLPGGVSQYDNSKYIFPDAPASDNPFGGSSPNYK